jgi:hypothetical protein
MKRLWFVIAAAFVLSPTCLLAADSIAASKTTMITKTGLRTGDNGVRFLNVQGKSSGEDGKYACFGVLDFTLPKPAANAQPAKIKSLSLKLTQSVARFSKEGSYRVELTEDSASDLSSTKFDSATTDGVGTQIKSRRALARSTFKPEKTGHEATIALKFDETTKAYVTKQLEIGGSLRILFVPDDANVAATFAGVEHAVAEYKPVLVIERD